MHRCTSELVYWLISGGNLILWKLCTYVRVYSITVVNIIIVIIFDVLVSFCYISTSPCISHRQLNKVMAQLDLLKSLFDRAGGSKHGSTVVTSSKNRRSAESVRTSI